MTYPTKRRQHGVALPVMLIILVVMLISSIYLLKASNSSTLSAANMAYDSALAKAADLGLHKGYQYLQTQSATNQVLLQADDFANGYEATYNTTQDVNDDNFWLHAATVNNLAAQNGTSKDDIIQYVVHRACINAGATNAAGNACMQTAGNPFSAGTSVAAGSSLASSTVIYTTPPRIHYIITARISGPRGGSVVNQLVVLI